MSRGLGDVYKRQELLNISGVGEKKAARYGNAFLRIIEDAVGSRE